MGMMFKWIYSVHSRLPVNNEEYTVHGKSIMILVFEWLKQFFHYSFVAEHVLVKMWKLSFDVEYIKLVD